MTQTNETPRGETAASAGASSAPAGSARIIKRYSNRKLYDTVESRYVTLPQIAVLLRKGEDVRIIDNNSKEDLTSVTLAQILYEEERKQSRALPLAALKDLIHTSGEKLISSLRESPVGKFIPAQKASEAPGAEAAPAAAASPPAAPTSPERVSSTPAAGSPERAPSSPAAPSSPEAATADAHGDRSKLSEIFEQSRASIQEWQHRVDERVRKALEDITPTNPLAELRAEVRALSQRLEQLEARLGATPPAEPREGRAPSQE